MMFPYCYLKSTTYCVITVKSVMAFRNRSNVKNENGLSKQTNFSCNNTDIQYTCLYLSRLVKNLNKSK